MRLDLSSGTLEKTAEFQSNEFGIGNDVVLMKIVREKIYSNPAKTICQEIMSNARDAHREVGKDSTPIEVILPNEYQPSYTVRDFGPGINPKRMKEVYLMYGNSTKRSDDSQTGGFGLGAKTPFALVDNFSIVTTTPEEIYVENGITYHNCLVKRTYIAVLNESGRGEVNLISEEKSEGPQGTDIVIPVDTEKFDAFNEYTEIVGRYWDVQPIVKGRSNFKFEEFKSEIEGKDWKLSLSTDYTITAVLDGIPYTVDRGNLKTEDFDIIKRYHIVLYFKCGELKVIANREDLEYNPKTIQALQTKLVQIKDAFIESLKNKISASPTLWDAYVKLNKFNNEIGIHEAQWQGYELKPTLHFNSNVYTVSKRNHKNKLNVYIDTQIKFDKPIILDDTPIVQGQSFEIGFINIQKKKKIKKFLEDNNEYSVQVLCFDPLAWVMEIKDDKGNVAKGSCVSQIKEKGLDQFPMTKLSSIVLEKQVRAPRTKSTEKRTKFKKFNTNGYREWNAWWMDCSFTNQDVKDVNTEHVYVTIDNRQAFFNAAVTPLHVIKDIVKNFTITPLYGVPIKELDKVASNPNWVLLEDVVKRDIKDKKIVDNSSISFNIQDGLGIYVHELLKRIVKKIEDKESLACRVMKIKTKEKLSAKYSTVLSLVPKCTDKVVDYSALVQEFNKMYPLMDLIRYRTDLDNEILWYINAKNKENVLTINDCVV